MNYSSILSDSFCRIVSTDTYHDIFLDNHRFAALFHTTLKKVGEILC